MWGDCTLPALGCGAEGGLEGPSGSPVSSMSDIDKTLYLNLEPIFSPEVELLVSSIFYKHPEDFLSCSFCSAAPSIKISVCGWVIGAVCVAHSISVQSIFSLENTYLSLDQTCFSLVADERWLHWEVGLLSLNLGWPVMSQPIEFGEVTPIPAPGLAIVSICLLKCSLLGPWATCIGLAKRSFQAYSIIWKTRRTFWPIQHIVRLPCRRALREALRMHERKVEQTSP